jgi:4-amino-4-deoxy-L-arabinose transferase-like glycosyltransferase
MLLMAPHARGGSGVKYSQQMRSSLANPKVVLAWLVGSLSLIWFVGMFCRGYWTPDEPREADIAWRMSWQDDKAVPQLAGEAFCEKPPMTYWLAALPVRLLGTQAWAARLPNFLYALITALAVGLTAARSLGRFGGLVAAAAIGTFLLSYQVAIWLATDAPLLAAVAVALLGAYKGFYASSSPERLRAYLLMHAALGFGFLSKSAVAWMVPALTIFVLSLWEKRWRELLRWELYAGLLLQAAMILTWVWFVYSGQDGPAHLRVFFWNNLVGRFAAVDAPPELQYAAAHRNYPGKYLVELPIYLFPWTLLVIAAARRAWLSRRSQIDSRALRFAIASSVPAVVILSLAATARNVYFAPVLPGIALLVAWWAREIRPAADRWDRRALRATAVLLLLGVAAFIAALSVIGIQSWSTLGDHAGYILISFSGLLAAAVLALRAWPASHNESAHSLWFLFLAYCALLAAPASQVYGQADTWQDLAKISRAVRHDAVGRPLILLAPDETTRAIVDMYARTSVEKIEGPIDAAALLRVRAAAAAAPGAVFLVQVRSSADLESSLPWMHAAALKPLQSYSLPHGRRYALLEVSR